MGRNMRYAKTAKKPSKPKTADRNDTVTGYKTKNWPGLPGGTQPKTRNFGMKKMKEGLAGKGV